MFTQGGLPLGGIPLGGIPYLSIPTSGVNIIIVCTGKSGYYRLQYSNYVHTRFLASNARDVLSRLQKDTNKIEVKPNSKKELQIALDIERNELYNL